VSYTAADADCSGGEPSVKVPRKLARRPPAAQRPQKIAGGRFGPCQTLPVGLPNPAEYDTTTVRRYVFYRAGARQRLNCRIGEHKVRTRSRSPDPRRKVRPRI
jgi:hypothetical protein